MKVYIYGLCLWLIDSSVHSFNDFSDSEKSFERLANSKGYSLNAGCLFGLSG